MHEIDVLSLYLPLPLPPPLSLSLISLYTLIFIAILCVACPEQVPFMADESVLAIEEFSKLDYSLKQYLIYAKIIQEKVKQLNKKGTYISLSSIFSLK